MFFLKEHPYLKHCSPPRADWLFCNWVQILFDKLTWIQVNDYICTVEYTLIFRERKWCQKVVVFTLLLQSELWMVRQQTQPVTLLSDILFNFHFINACFLELLILCFIVTELSLNSSYIFFFICCIYIKKYIYKNIYI